MPRPLPRGLLAGLARNRRLLLCLDYDGTLAEICAEPERAVPVAGAGDALRALIALPQKISVAVVTGRRLRQVKLLLGIGHGLFFSGVHGLEFENPDGTCGFAADARECGGELQAVREWLARRVPPGRGFMVEDKVVAIGLHYRLADPAEAAIVCGEFERFVEREAPCLRLLHLKMLLEALPAIASKARALAELRSRAAEPVTAVYIGDDATDEDAFAALAPQDVGILVGGARQSLAAYRIDSPAAVVAELASIAESLESMP